MNIEEIKRIMSEKKTTLPSLRNQDWKKSQSRNWKNNLIINTYLTNNITELNELIYAGAKLVYDKTVFP